MDDFQNGILKKKIKVILAILCIDFFLHFREPVGNGSKICKQFFAWKLIILAAFQ